MEDMARLALVEQNIRDVDKFSNMLYELLRHINYILENPHDYELRAIKSELLKKELEQEAFSDYLKSIGFEATGGDYTYPKGHTLSKLRMAQAAIERKIYFCCGSIKRQEVSVKPSHSTPAKNNQLTPSNVLRTNNRLLQKIETLFNTVLVYESEELQELAREHIPLVTLQLMALDRVREQQRKIKSGELEGHDLPFDIALLMELLGWFKHKFFTWMDKPACESCGGATAHVQNVTKRTETGICKVEIYKCTQCVNGDASFWRYNDPRTLLRTRRGRCGEWANCFTLLCRALGYDTRYVYDITDHVWCEVFDYDSNTWLHVDPCEAKLNAPLLYSHGWGKKLSYVIAVSRDDLQDVTWRYTTNHAEVLKRRTECDERQLVDTILSLREHRQRQVSEARRRYLAKRCLQELVQLMVEKKPTDYESHGRISGSKEWRATRGETGPGKGHVFTFDSPGQYCIEYYSTIDKYRVLRDEHETATVDGWSAGAFESENIFRKLEQDWQMVYLAREEDEPTGAVAWKICTQREGVAFRSLSFNAKAALYEDGVIDFVVQFDDSKPMPVVLAELPRYFERPFRTVVIRASLRGGRGALAWQHAQLFRAPSSPFAAVPSPAHAGPALRLKLTLE